MTDRPPAGVARSAGTALLTQIVTAAFTAALTLFLIRRLGPADFGVFSLAMGIGGLAMLPADFGIAHSASRYVAEHRDDAGALRRVIASAIRLKILTGAAVAIALAVLAGPLAAAFDQPALAWALRAMAVAVFAQSLLNLFLQIYIGLRRLDVNLRLVGFESLVEVGASVALVLATGGAAAAAWGRGIGYAAGALVALVLTLRRFGVRMPSLRPVAEAPPIARYAGVMLVVNGIYSLFSQLDVLLIGALLTATAVGQFSAPLRLAALLHYPGLAISNAVSPRLARTATSEPDVATFRKALRLSIVVHAVLIAPLLVWAEPIVDLVLGDDYENSSEVLRAMTPFIVLQGIGPLLAVSVNYLGEARRRVPVAVAALLVNLAIDLALLREIGVVAGAIGSSAGFAVYVAGHARICHRLLDLHPQAMLLTTARALLAAAAMAGVLALFGTGEVPVPALVAGMVAGLAIFAVVLVASREVRAEDVAFARSVVRRS